MYLLFAGLVGSTFFILLIWGGAMVYRLYNPEHPRPLEERPVVKRERVAPGGQPMKVGVREIRVDQRWAQRKRGRQAGYTWGRSDGIPDAWHEQLWVRRN